MHGSPTPARIRPRDSRSTPLLLTALGFLLTACPSEQVEEPSDTPATPTALPDGASPTPPGGSSSPTPVTGVSPTPIAPSSPTPTPTLPPTPTPKPGDSDGDGVLDADDCADSDALSYPDAPELCDRIDNDCDGKVDESLYQGGEDKGNCGIYFMNPSTGAMGMPQALTVMVDFYLVSYVDHGTITGLIRFSDGYELPLLNPQKDPDLPTRIRFDPAVLTYGLNFTVEVSSVQNDVDPPGSGWTVKARSFFTREAPCGVLFETSEGMQIVKMGATNPQVLAGINNQMAANIIPLGLSFLDLSSASIFPLDSVSVSLGVMAGDLDGINFYVDPYYGFPTLLTDGELLADGTLAFPPQDVAVLVPANNTVGNLFTTDMVLSGKLETSGGITTFASYAITGVVKKNDLHKMLVETDQVSTENLFVPDLDLDEDGVKDAFTQEIIATPVLSNLLDCAP